MTFNFYKRSPGLKGLLRSFIVFGLIDIFYLQSYSTLQNIDFNNYNIEKNISLYEYYTKKNTSA